MSEPTRFPLAWPAHRPRHKGADRIRGAFSEAAPEGARTKTKLITLTTACDRLEEQIERLGGIYPLLSTNMELKMDGRPRADRAAPADPGAAVYFTLKGRPVTLACDTFDDVAQNVAGLANHIDALRRQERYGVATAEESLQAFMALPAPAPQEVSWRAVFGLTENAFREMEKEDLLVLIDGRYRRLVRGASEAALVTLNAARDAARRELRG